MRGANLSRARVSNAFVMQTDMTDAIMRGTKFIRANLTNSDLTGADLQDADLTDANLSGARLERCDPVGRAVRQRQIDQRDHDRDHHGRDAAPGAGIGGRHHGEAVQRTGAGLPELLAEHAAGWTAAANRVAAPISVDST